MSTSPSQPGTRPEVVFDEKAIDTLFAPIDQCGLPGAAVGIALRGKPLYRKGLSG